MKIMVNVTMAVTMAVEVDAESEVDAAMKITKPENWHHVLYGAGQFNSSINQTEVTKISVIKG